MGSTMRNGRGGGQLGTAALWLWLSACGTDGAALSVPQDDDWQGIRNGIPTATAEYSGVGAINRPGADNACTGSLIGRSLVLTAAQCVRSGGAEPLTFTLPGRLAEVRKVAVHPLSDGPEGFNLTFDVALLRLEKPESRAWDERRLFVADTLLPIGTVAFGAGVGESSSPPGTRTRGDLLLTQYIGGEGPVGVIRPAAFTEVVPGTADDHMFCPGDQGGPLYYHGATFGVASFRFVETCDEVGPGYYLNTPHVFSWIRDTAFELDPPGACSGEDTEAFVTSGGGCLDTATGLVWSSPSSSSMTYADAVTYCDELEESGHDDWHLAIATDLGTLGRDEDQNADDDPVDAELEVWSASPRGANRASTYDFSLGHRWTRPRTNLYPALCAREPLAP